MVNVLGSRVSCLQQANSGSYEDEPGGKTVDRASIGPDFPETWHGSPLDREEEEDITAPHLRGLERELEALDARDETGGIVNRWLLFLHNLRGILCCKRSNRAQSDDNEDLPDLIETNQAQAFFGTAIVVHAVYVGLETDFRNITQTYRDPAGLPWFIMDSIFMVVFIVELALRIKSSRDSCKGFREPWMVFDALLVVVGIFDVWVAVLFLSDHAVGGKSGNASKVMRLMRLMRVLRIVRLFKFFKELSLLAQGILGALQAMTWAFLLIIIVLYISAVLMTNLFGKDSKLTSVKGHFGSIGASVFTLFTIMTLEEWPEIVRNVMREQQFAFLLFVPFMMFMNFAMLNVMTAVVVEKVLSIANVEAAAEARREERNRSALLRKIKQLFKYMDGDNSAELELSEFREALKNPVVVQQFMELGIAKYEADDLFACLDLNGNCQLSVVEFVEGCLRVHGPAHSKHLLQVQYDVLRNRESLRKDLNTLGWYVRWLIRHLSNKFGWKNKKKEAVDGQEAAGMMDRVDSKNREKGSISAPKVTVRKSESLVGSPRVSTQSLPLPYSRKSSSKTDNDGTGSAEVDTLVKAAGTMDRVDSKNRERATVHGLPQKPANDETASPGGPTVAAASNSPPSSSREPAVVVTSESSYASKYLGLPQGTSSKSSSRRSTLSNAGPSGVEVLPTDASAPGTMTEVESRAAVAALLGLRNEQQAIRLHIEEILGDVRSLREQLLQISTAGDFHGCLPLVNQSVSYK
eukprot:TRINITY_DN5663_c0_g1_i2.p1 TRINITY_DN5663_c0_g1~~TRINITY_DN5663_c0_g1_i2.p1  ORF type:complete len:757 (+),score=126.69 TRINITY_DN5663_c0_g1_i2:26-2272(+)